MADEPEAAVNLRLLTVEDAADVCKVHPKTVRRAIWNGRLRAARLGERGAYRIRTEDLDNWIEASVVLVEKAPDPSAVTLASLAWDGSGSARTGRFEVPEAGGDR